MRVLRISVENQISGVFAAIPNQIERPGNVVDFAVCQICRVTRNDERLNNPANFLGWKANENWEQVNRIKIQTLNNNGWFVDNLWRNNEQNYLYYMESFPVEEGEAILNGVNGEQTGGVLYISPDAGEGVSQENYNIQFSPNVVVIGHNNEQYPFMRDNPQQQPGTILDFQVHLLYRSENNGNTTIHISGGFRWQHDGNNHHSPFQGLLVGASEEFVQCVRNGINIQNEDNGTHWQLQV